MRPVASFAALSIGGHTISRRERMRDFVDRVRRGDADEDVKREAAAYDAECDRVPGGGRERARRFAGP